MPNIQIRSARYYKIKNGKREGSAIHKAWFTVTGKTESTVTAYLKQQHRGYDIELISVDWA